MAALNEHQKRVLEKNSFKILKNIAQKEGLDSMKMQYQVIKDYLLKYKGVGEHIIIFKKMNDENVGPNIINLCNY
jgi:hypothetical protein